MRVFLDHEEVAVDTSDTPTLGQVIDMLQPRLKGSGRGVCSVLLDRAEIPGWESDRRRRLEDVDQIHLLTAPLPQLLYDAARSVGTYLPRLEQGLARASQRFLQGHDQEGSELLGQAVEGLQWYTTFLAGLTRLGPDLSHAAGRRIKLLSRNLKTIVDVWEKGDYSLLADLLQYELVPEIVEARSWLDGWIEGAHSNED